MTTTSIAAGKSIDESSGRVTGELGALRFAWILVVALIGLALSVVLSVVHYRSHTDPSYEALCAVSDRVNCESVALSHYSIWFGIPVSVWGLLAYLATSALAASGLRRRRSNPGWPLGGLTVMAAGAVGVSAYLAYVSIRYIDSVCIYCTGLYVVNVAWLALTLRGRLSWTRLASDAVADLRAVAGRPRVALVIGALGLAALVALEVWFPRYFIGSSAHRGAEPGSGATDDGAHFIGDPSASLTIVEYTDYECPHCRRAHRDIRARIARAPVPARLVHKHFPLDQACNPTVTRPFHRRACELSRFVECAGRQGKFWPANDAVFAALDRTRAADLDLAALAAELSLDTAALDRCLGDPTVAALVARDVADGQALGIRGTPTYVVGQALHAGRLPHALLEGASQPAAGSSEPSHDRVPE